MLDALAGSLFFRMMVNNRGNLQQLSPELLDAVLPFFGCSFARRDTIVIKPGDSASASLLLVAKGSVKLVTDKFELATVGPGGWFGGEALIEETAGYTAIAEEDTVCLSLNASGGRAWEA